MPGNYWERARLAPLGKSRFNGEFPMEEKVSHPRPREALAPSVLILRIAGMVEILAFFAVVMPRSWMEISHTWLGMGVMPDGPLIMFMIRQASYVYGMHGVSLLILASDIDRFRPLIIFNGLSFLLAALVFFLIDYSSGMPWYWTIADPLGCGLFGAVLLWFNRIRQDP
jgi:hypothetical protein